MNKGASFRFRLYVAGDGPHSMQAIANLHEVCNQCLAGRHEIEVIDVLKDKRRALDDGVMLTPLLIKLSPRPVCKVVGNLTHRDSLLQTLGIAARNP